MAETGDANANEGNNLQTAEQQAEQARRDQALLDQQATNNDATHQPVMFNGTLPGPTGLNVATEIAKIPITEQRKCASDFYNFLIDQNKILLQLNTDPMPRTEH